MGNFDRGGRSSGGRGFPGRSFNDRSSRGPVQMNQAVCSNCGKSCEVPFRPTSGKPVFCSSCFENNRGEEKQMFDAVCADCGNSCQVPFRPSGDKPVFCSNCFGEKKGSGDRGREQFQPQSKEQFEQLNNKLDKILAILKPNTVAIAAVEEIIEEAKDQRLEEQTVDTKKKPSKKKKIT